MMLFSRSVTQYLAIEAVAASSLPLRCCSMQWLTKTLATVASVLHSASTNCVFWKSRIDLPNALRCLT